MNIAKTFSMSLILKNTLIQHLVSEFFFKKSIDTSIQSDWYYFMVITSKTRKQTEAIFEISNYSQIRGFRKISNLQDSVVYKQDEARFHSILCSSGLYVQAKEVKQHIAEKMQEEA